MSEELEQQNNDENAPFGECHISSLVKAIETWVPVKHITTGFREFDEAMGGGLRVGGVHLLVGRTGNAKTQTAVQVALNASLAGIPVGFFSLEQSRAELTRLAIAKLSGIPRQILDRRLVPKQYKEVFDHTRSQLQSAKLLVLDDHHWEAGFTREDLTKVVKPLSRYYRWQLVVLDYLSLLAPEKNDGSAFESDLLNSAALKRIASDCGVAILVIGAFRKPSTQKGRRQEAPDLEDVLGASRLVYDATSVWRIETEGGHSIKLTCLKSRFSAGGTAISLPWDPNCGFIGDQPPTDAEGTTPKSDQAEKVKYLERMQPAYEKALKRKHKHVAESEG